MFIEGRYVGAQAAATAVLDTLLAKVLGGQMDYLGRTDHWGRNKKYQQTQILKLPDIIEKESSSADPNHALALKLIIPPATRAFQPTGQADMTEYNRNATIHRASETRTLPRTL